MFFFFLFLFPPHPWPLPQRTIWFLQCPLRKKEAAVSDWDGTRSCQHSATTKWMSWQGHVRKPTHTGCSGKWNCLLIVNIPFPSSSHRMPNPKEGKHAKFEVLCLHESASTNTPDSRTLASFQNTTCAAIPVQWSRFPPSLSAFFCFICFHQAILEKFPGKMTCFPNDSSGNLNTSCLILSLCVYLLIWFGTVAWGSTYTFWGHTSDSACSCTFSPWARQACAGFTLALLIDSLASSLWNWNMFPRSCIYKC